MPAPAAIKTESPSPGHPYASLADPADVVADPEPVRFAAGFTIGSAFGTGGEPPARPIGGGTARRRQIRVIQCVMKLDIDPPVRPSLGPADVPFIGWSRTSHNFRTLAARLAPGGNIAPLFVGEPGVGKRTMARVWQHLAGGEVAFPIVDLDRNPGDLPGRWIGHSSRLPGRGTRCYLLGSGCPGGMPDSGTAGPVLPAHLMGRFDVVIHVPPIRGHREVDVLAYLDLCARVRFPAAGYPFQRIEMGLLRRMLLGRDWPGNFSELGRFVESTARNNASAIRLGAADEGPPMLADIPALSHSLPATSGPGEVDEVDLHSMKDFAVAAYLTGCRLAVGLGVAPSEDGATVDRVLLADALWLSGGQVKPLLGHREFGTLGIDEFVRDEVLLGLRFETREQQDLLARVRNQVVHGPVLGATFESLRAGLAVDLVEGGSFLVDRPAPAASDDHTRGETSAGGRGESLGFFNYRVGRKFEIEFRLGDVAESAVFARGSSIGLGYYWILVNHPGRIWSAVELNGTLRALEKDGRPVVISKDEAEANRLNKGLAPEGVIDPQARAQALELQRETEEELLAARKARDFEEIEILEEKLRKINKFLSISTYRGRIKELDRSQVSALQNVERALRRAKATLREEMPELARHLEGHVKKNGASWVYKPPGGLQFEADGKSS